MRIKIDLKKQVQKEFDVLNVFYLYNQNRN